MLMSRQELFDFCIAHMYAQGRQAAVDNACMYRGPGGTCCNIGALLPDSEYDTRMEKLGAFAVIEQLVRPGIIYSPTLILYDHHAGIEFLECLQNLHDRPINWIRVKSFNAHAAEIASQFNLQFTPRDVPPGKGA